MSETHARFRQELDHSGNPFLGALLVITMLIFGVATEWGYQILKRHLRALEAVGPGAIPPQANGAGVGIVIHAMFDALGDRPPTEVAGTRQLASYGWADREAGRIHVPIDSAIERVVELHARPGADSPAPGATPPPDTGSPPPGQPIPSQPPPRQP